MSRKYKVGDLLTTGLYLYLVVEIKNSKYYVKETERDHLVWWDTIDADRDRHLEKVN
jgi:hypothetical protein